MSAEMDRKDNPRNGLARALFNADPDTPLEDLPELLDDIPTWQCTNCGHEGYVRPETCSQCEETTFEKITTDSEECPDS